MKQRSGEVGIRLTIVFLVFGMILGGYTFSEELYDGVEVFVSYGAYLSGKGIVGTDMTKNGEEEKIVITEESIPNIQDTGFSEGTVANEDKNGERTTSSTTTVTPTTPATTTQLEKEAELPENTLKISEQTMTKANTEYNGIAVRNSTSGYEVDIKKLLSEKPDIAIKFNSEPQVLIVHTHTSETYQTEDRGYYLESDPTRTTDKSKNIVRVADEIEEKLEDAGIKTLHVTTFHDYPKYNGAYGRALDTINSYLSKYPSIQVVLDVHRDSIESDSGTKTKPTTEINGKKAAQIMIISGCDNNGKLDFPDWKYNLRFGIRLQQKMNEKYPTLARPLSFAPYRYNMHATHGSLLVEFGTDVNTLDEAIYSGQLFGECLVEVLTELKA